jgi:methyl-accepting chemotaxis protein
MATTITPLMAPAANLLKRLSFGKKFLLIGATISVPLLVLSGILYAERSGVIEHARQEYQGLEHISAIRSLLEQVAGTRDLTRTYLAGDTGAASRLAALRDSVNRDFDHLADLEAATASEPAGVPSRAIAQRWQQLTASALQNVEPSTFDGYSKIIGELVALMDRTAQQSGLISDKRLGNFYMAESLALRLPNLADGLGKLRSTGADVLEAGTTSAVQMLTLRHATDAVDKDFQRLRSTFKQLFTTDPDLQQQLGNAYNNVDAAISNYMTVTRRQIIDAQQPTPDASRYLADGAATIDTVYELFDETAPRLGASLQERVSAAHNEELVFISLVAGVLLLVAYFFSGFYLSTRQSLEQLAEAVKRFANGDLTFQPHSDSRDELGAVTTQMSLMIEKMNALVSQVISAAGQVGSSAEQTAATMSQSNAGIQQQNSEIDQVATAIEEMSATVQEVARNAAAAAEAADRANSASGNGNRVVSDVGNSIQSLSNEVNQATAIIRELESESDNIGTVLDVIRGIAEQTNLLALNAAIEAARAGEQGRGFAVVADEVRTLASRTQQSTEEIHGMIDRLQQGARNAVNAMQSGQEKSEDSVRKSAEAHAALQSIETAVGEINDMNAQIASAAEEQSAVAEEINRNVVAIRDISSHTTAGLQQTVGSSQALLQVARQLQSLVNEFKV